MKLSYSIAWVQYLLANTECVSFPFGHSFTHSSMQALTLLFILLSTYIYMIEQNSWLLVSDLVSIHYLISAPLVGITKQQYLFCS